MKTLKVLDSSGDRTTSWDETKPETWCEAQGVFNDVLRTGGAVFLEQKDGSGGGKVNEFNPQADMLAVPRIEGG